MTRPISDPQASAMMRAMGDHVKEQARGLANGHNPLARLTDLRSLTLPPSILPFAISSAYDLRPPLLEERRARCTGGLGDPVL